MRDCQCHGDISIAIFTPGRGIIGTIQMETYTDGFDRSGVLVLREEDINTFGNK